MWLAARRPPLHSLRWNVCRIERGVIEHQAVSGDPACTVQHLDAYAHVVVVARAEDSGDDAIELRVMVRCEVYVHDRRGLRVGQGEGHAHLRRLSGDFHETDVRPIVLRLLELQQLYRRTARGHTL